MNKWYSLRCRIALAKELEIAPDDLDVEPVLEMVESAVFQGENGRFEVNLIPENDRQNEAIINNYYDEVLNRIFEDKSPFKGFLENVLEEREVI